MLDVLVIYFLYGLRPTFERSKGVVPCFRAGEFGWRVKSPFWGSVKRGAVDRLFLSTPSFWSLVRTACPNLGSALQ